MDTNYLIVLGILLFLKFRGESNVLYLGVALVSIYFIMNNETEGFDYLDLPRCSPSASPSYDKDKNLTIPLVKYDTAGKKSCISVTIPHWKGECGGSEKGLCEEGSTCDSNYKCSPCPPGFFGPMCESPPPPSPNIFYKTCPLLSVNKYAPSPSSPPSPGYSTDVGVYLSQIFGIDGVLPFNPLDKCFHCEPKDIDIDITKDINNIKNINNINFYFGVFIFIIIVFLVLSVFMGKSLRKRRTADMVEQRWRPDDI